MKNNKAGGYKNMGPNGNLKNMGYDKSKSSSQSKGNAVDLGGYPGAKGVVSGLHSPRK